MNYTKNEYIKEVLKNINVPKKVRLRIKEDISDRIEDAMSEDPYFDLERELGSPIEYAQDFNENVEEMYPDLLGAIRSFNTSKKPYEYESKVKLFGLPLVHINLGGGYAPRQARGIFALGDVAMGLVSVGGVAVGGISIGGVSVGLFSVGGVAIALAGAVGGVAVGAYAIGGVAIGIVNAIGAVLM